MLVLSETCMRPPRSGQIKDLVAIQGSCDDLKIVVNLKEVLMADHCHLEVLTYVQQKDQTGCR